MIWPYNDRSNNKDLRKNVDELMLLNMPLPLLTGQNMLRRIAIAIVLADHMAVVLLIVLYGVLKKIRDGIVRCEGKCIGKNA